MAYALDFGFFKQPGGDIIIKELAILPLDYEADPIILLFKPPFPWQRLNEKYKRENEQLKLTLHGLSWDSGDINYSEIGKLIRDTLKDSNKIFVIGETKKKYIERYKYNAVDIIDLGYLQVDMTKAVHICFNHDIHCKKACAVQNVKIMKKFLHTQKQWEDISMEWEYA